MKALILGASILLVAVGAAQAAPAPAKPSAKAEVASLPASKNDSILGGEVLLQHNKPAIVISGGENQMILRELGEAKRKSFYRDIISERSIDSLLSDYARSDRPATHAVIWRYESIHSQLVRK